MLVSNTGLYCHTQLLLHNYLPIYRQLNSTDRDAAPNPSIRHTTKQAAEGPGAAA